MTDAQHRAGCGVFCYVKYGVGIRQFSACHAACFVRHKSQHKENGPAIAVYIPRLQVEVEIRTAAAPCSAVQ